MILLEEIDTSFGKIQIVESKDDGTRTYLQNECIHSSVNAEGVSTFAYIHIIYSVLRQSGARNILMIGCAGGTLATMLHRLGCTVTVVDINPQAFLMAKKYFQMPEEAHCVVEDGCVYLANSEQCFDAVVVDVFDCEGVIPVQFTNRHFFKLVQSALRPTGVVIMNVLVKNDTDFFADRLALTIKECGLPVVLYDWLGRRGRNTLVTGGITHLQIVPEIKPHYIRFELQGMVRRELRAIPSGNYG